MKNIINNILKYFGYIIQKNRQDYFTTEGLLYPFAQTLISNKDCNNFTIVQVGANLGLDGKLKDPIRKFIINNPTVNGILVEPMIEYLDVVKRIYSKNENLHFENIAIGREKGELKLLRFKPGVDYNKDYYDGLATLKENRIEELKNRAKNDNTEVFLEEISVPVFPANYLKEKYSLKEIEILQVDTEGFDLIVIESFFSANIFPTLINFEFTELTETEYQAGIIMFKKFNYKLYLNGSDILAVLNNCPIFD